MNSKTVFNIIYEIANLLLLINFYFSHLLYKEKENRIRVGLLYYYTIGALIVYFLEELFRFSFIKSSELRQMSGLFFVIFHFVILSLFILKNSKNKTYKYWIFFSELLVLFLFIYQDFKFQKYYSASISNIFLIFHCFYYYLNLVKKREIIYLENDPIFFTVNGVFLGSGILTPVLLFGNYLHTYLDADTYFWIALIAPISSIVMYSMFFKSLKCISKKRI